MKGDQQPRIHSSEFFDIIYNTKCDTDWRDPNNSVLNFLSVQQQGKDTKGTQNSLPSHLYLLDHAIIITG